MNNHEVYDFGLRLKALRKQQGLTLREVGQKLGLSWSAVGAYERNIQYPTVENLAKLALLYNVSLDYLMNMEKPNVISVDGLTESQKDTIRKVVNDLKKEFSKYKKSD